MRTGLLVLVILPLLAVADITGEYRLLDGKNMTLHYRDADHLRMEVGSDQFMLVSDDKVYMVNRQGDQWTAMDMSAMGAMMSQMGMSPGKSSAEDAQDPGQYQFEDTGREESIAGYTGKVYQVVGPQGDRTEVVLSTHADIRSLTRGWLAFSGKMMSGIGMTSVNQLKAMLEQEVMEKMGGALRVENGMRLHSVSKQQRADAFYELPPGTRVQQVPSMGAGMPQQQPSAGNGKGDSGGQNDGGAARKMMEGLFGG